jgi:hypothetical protein
MVARKHLVVVVPGIGGSVLELTGKVAWDAGFGSVTGLGVTAHRLSLAEAPAMRPPLFPGHLGRRVLSQYTVPAARVTWAGNLG